MIKNDRQYAIVRSRADRLTGLRDELLENVRIATDQERARSELELRAVSGELNLMREDLAEYEALRAGTAPVKPPSTLEDIPRLLIQARIAAGMTQAELATRVGLKPQQIQKYEATDYEGASLGRLAQIASGLDVRLDPAPAEGFDGVTKKAVQKRLEQSGIPRTLIRRLHPSARAMPEEIRAAGMVARAARVFGWDPAEVLAGPVQLREVVAAAYKAPARAKIQTNAALTLYAAYLSQVIVPCVTHTPRLGPLSNEPTELHREIVARAGGTPSLSAAVDVLWDHGVVVIPLQEPGGFHAACWYEGIHPVVVLNSAQLVESRWLFDLLHEIGHLVNDDWLARSGALVESAPGHDVAATEDEEKRANEFATQVLLGGQSEQLFEQVMRKAGGAPAKLQRAVLSVARTQEVSAPALAFNVAYRLSQVGTNWWGAAINLQPKDTDGWQTVRDHLVQRVDWALLSPLDADLLSVAFREPSPYGVDE